MEVEDTHNFAANGIIIHNSETAGIQLSRALAKLGHHVTVFCNTQRAHRDHDVLYQPVGWIHHPQGSFPKGFIDYCRSTPVDVCVVQRIPAFYGFGLETKVNLLWQHDLATRTGPSNFHGQLWNIDKILVLSEFMRKQYQSVHGGPDRLYHVTRNGIDLETIDSVPEQQRDRFRLTFTARPERGLDILLQRVFPQILKMEPRATLYLSRYSDPAILPLYQEMDGLIKSFGDKIVFMGNLGKKALYEHYKKSRLFIYPSAFEEISWITCQEVSACGGVVIGPWRGACPETANGTNVLLRDDGSPGRPEDAVEPGFRGVSDNVCTAAAERAVELMHDDEQWGKLARGARANAERWTWEPVARDWTELCHDLIERRSSDPIRLAKHFLVHCDVVAAKRLAERTDDKRVKVSTQAYIDKFVPFMGLPEGSERHEAINEFYEQRSGGEQANWMTGFFADQEPRLKALLMWLEPKVKAGEVKTILDFGCAHGGYARVISNMYPEVKIVGVDNSPSLIRCANEMKAGKLDDGSPACKHPDNLQFLIADEDTKIRCWNDTFYGAGEVINEQTGHPYESVLEKPAQFDCVICMEVLEHLPNSEEVARKLERHCRPNGHMVFTVPTGRRDRDDLVTKGVPPVHVRSFDLHDLRDMFDHRKGCQIVSFSDLKELEYDRSFAGWLMVTYQKDDKKVGEIDWDRKLSLQGPRETLAVCMITHNSDKVLRRCLASVRNVADQLIVVDNGPSTDRTVETALEFGAQVRAGTSPHYCYTHMVIHPWDQIQPGVCEPAGFETPRNESIDGIWADHICWIDSDEFFTQPAAVFKYLRPNTYYGYAVQQHHLSVDAGKLKIDLPVRIFRNHMGIKCFGKVHEHFEIGPNRGMGNDCMAMPDLHISHDGYIDEDTRRQRFARNLKLLECDRLKYPDRVLGTFLYDVRDRLHMARYSIEQAGGKLTDEARRHCELVIEAYRKHFMGAGHFAVLAIDGLQYYSEALAILGLGAEFCVAVDAKRAGTGAPPYEKFRAMDKGEALRIIDMKLTHLTQQFEGPYAA